jgi:hypothetical protein
VPEYFGIFYVPYLERMRVRLWFFFGFSAAGNFKVVPSEQVPTYGQRRVAVGGPASCQCQPRRWCETHGPGGSTSMKCSVRLATNLSEKQRQGRQREAPPYRSKMAYAHHIIPDVGLCAASHACSDRSREKLEHYNISAHFTSDGTWDRSVMAICQFSAPDRAPSKSIEPTGDSLFAGRDRD